MIGSHGLVFQLSAAARGKVKGGIEIFSSNRTQIFEKSRFGREKEG
jgi:hypothetical protein